MKKGLVILLLYYKTVFIFGNFSINESKGIVNFLTKGDKLILSDEGDEARLFNENTNPQIKSSNYEYYLAKYKSGYSYLRENENSLALTCFKETELSFIPLNLKDSALYFLTGLEIDVLNLNAIKPDFSVEPIFHNLPKYSRYLKKIEKNRLQFIIGEICFQRLEYNAAIAEYMKLINQTITDKWLEESLYKKLARSYELIRDYPNSIEYYLLLLNSNPIYYDKIDILKSIGKVYHNIYKYDIALNYFTEAEALISPDKNVSDQIAILSYMGNCLFLLGDTLKANAMYDKAEVLSTKFLVTGDELIYIYLAKIYFYQELKQYDKCEEYINKAFKVLSLMKVSGYNINSLYLQACRYYSEKGEVEKVIKLANELSGIYKTNGDKSLSLTSLDLYHSVLRYKGIALWDIWARDSIHIQQLYNAKKVFEDVLNISSDIFRQQNAELSKLVTLKTLRRDYDNLFITTTTINKLKNDPQLIHESYSYLQKVKANLFNSYMQESKASMYKGLPTHLLNDKSELKKQIERLGYHINKKVAGNGEDAELKLLYLELTKARVRLDSIEGVLESNYPEYKSIKSGSINYKISDIQDVINDDQLVVDYFIAENRLFIMVVSSGSFSYIESNVEGNLLDDIRSYREMIEWYAPYGDYQEQFEVFTRMSYKLYKTIIEPIDTLKNNKHLIIIPDREMNLIPVETLIESNEGISISGGYGSLPYLVKSNPVTTLYTVNQLFEKRSRLTNRSRFIGFAPDYSIVTDSSITLLPGAKDEVNLLDYYFKGTGYYGTEASKQNFLEESYKYDIVHLAMHTKINDYNPRHSQLLLTGKQAGKDSLTIFEVYGMKFKTKLMVLSGCNTGSGELNRGEGVMSLARSFFYAGVDNIILTKWAVADKSSSKLMRHFYKHLKDGHATDKSLQMAKLNYLQQEDPVKLHPYYWSGYISVGKPVGNSIKQRNIKLYLILALLLSFSISYFFYKKNKR